MVQKFLLTFVFLQCLFNIGYTHKMQTQIKSFVYHLLFRMKLVVTVNYNINIAPSIPKSSFTSE